jgi:precorrin-4/cobalt-precorrin-4 C11-methyltransferase
MASAAAAAESLTLPEVTQTVILTRVEGRTPMPEGESLEELARHRCTLCLFLSVGLLGKVRGGDLLAAGWHEDAPVLIVQKASWPGEEKILRGTLADIREKCRAEKIRSQAMIIVSLALGARGWPSLKKSKLYDAGFAHRYRRGSKPRGSD